MIGKLCAGGLALALAFGAGMAFAQAQSGRTPQFENAQVRVWKSLIQPNSPLPMHRHDHPRIVVALQGGTMSFPQSDGRSETRTWETGKAYWLDAMPPGLMHQDINAGDRPIEVMMIELKTAP